MALQNRKNSIETQTLIFLLALSFIVLYNYGRFYEFTTGEMKLVNFNGGTLSDMFLQFRKDSFTSLPTLLLSRISLMNGSSEIILRTPFIILSIFNLLLLYILSSCYSQNKNQRLTSVIIFLIFPMTIFTFSHASHITLDIAFILIAILVHKKNPKFLYPFALFSPFFSHLIVSLFLLHIIITYQKRKKHDIYLTSLLLFSLFIYHLVFNLPIISISPLPLLLLLPPFLTIKFPILSSKPAITTIILSFSILTLLLIPYGNGFKKTASYLKTLNLQKYVIYTYQDEKEVLSNYMKGFEERTEFHILDSDFSPSPPPFFIIFERMDSKIEELYVKMPTYRIERRVINSLPNPVNIIKISK